MHTQCRYCGNTFEPPQHARQRAGGTESHYSSLLCNDCIRHLSGTAGGEAALQAAINGAKIRYCRKCGKRLLPRYYYLCGQCSSHAEYNEHQKVNLTVKPAHVVDRKFHPNRDFEMDCPFESAALPASYYTGIV